MIPFPTEPEKPDAGVYVYSRDPAVIAANPPEAVEAYQLTGDLGSIETGNATRFHLRPLSPAVLWLLRAPLGAVHEQQEAALAFHTWDAQRRAGEPVDMDAAPSLMSAAAPYYHAFEQVSVSVVATALHSVEGWPEPGPGGYGPMLANLATANRLLAAGVVAELYARVMAMSDPKPEPAAGED